MKLSLSYKTQDNPQQKKNCQPSHQYGPVLTLSHHSNQFLNTYCAKPIYLELTGHVILIQ
jgi:hypothetical protein